MRYFYELLSTLRYFEVFFRYDEVILLSKSSGSGLGSRIPGSHFFATMPPTYLQSPSKSQNNGKHPGYVRFTLASLDHIFVFKFKIKAFNLKEERQSKY